MTDPVDEMLRLAAAARENAHAPYSGFAVGACLRSDDGRLFSGCNVENVAYPQGQCAESSALGALVTAGATRVVEILVLAGGEALCTPCGGCRQRLREFADAATPVRIAGPEGVRASFALGDLLPEAFVFERKARP